MSGSLTISISGTPARLRSTRLTGRSGSCVSLPASSSMWMRRMRTALQRAVDRDVDAGRARRSAARTARSGSPWAGRGRSSSCGRSGSRGRWCSRSPAPCAERTPPTVRLSTGRTPGRPRHTGQVWVLGAAAERGGAAAEDLGVGLELGVDLKADDRLELHLISWRRGPNKRQAQGGAEACTLSLSGSATRLDFSQLHGFSQGVWSFGV